MDDIEELVLKWRNLFDWGSFINNTVDEQILALKMEMASRYIINLPYNNDDSRSRRMIETSIMPIIFRIINNGGEIGEIPIFYDRLLLFYNRNMDTITDLRYVHSGIDVEAELCALFTQEYLSDNYNPITPKKFLKPWMKLKNGF